VPIYYNTLLRHHEATEKQDSSRKERAEKSVAAKKCHDKNNHLQYSYYARTQKHFATTFIRII
jgi:hypothetical protein